MIGLPLSDVLPSSFLIGQKTFFTEFVAYQTLGDMIGYREQGYPRCDCNGNIQWLSERSEILTTYALSGFSNIPSMAIMLGGLGGLAPAHQSKFSKLVVRALAGGLISCMVRACVASLLFDPPGGAFNWGNINLKDCSYGNSLGLGADCDIICNDITVNSTFSCSIYNK